MAAAVRGKLLAPPPSYPPTPPPPSPAATCPKDCSGHGVCRTISEIAAGALNKFSYKSLGGHRYFSGVRNAFSYDRWDGSKHQSCICDPGYTGYDCTAKVCPRGDDPLTQGPTSCGGAPCTWDIQSFTLADTTATTFRLGMVTSFNETVTAYASLDVAYMASGYVAPANRASLLSGPTTVAGILQDALRGLPGGLYQRVEVYPAADASLVPGSDISRTFRVTFVGVAGSQEQLMVDAISGPGSLWYNPDHPLYDSGSPVAASRSVVTLARGNFEELECSGRGLCDSSSGLCTCFAGFTGAFTSCIIALRAAVVRWHVFCLSPATTPPPPPTTTPTQASLAPSRTRCRCNSISHPYCTPRVAARSPLPPSCCLESACLLCRVSVVVQQSRNYVIHA